MRLAVVIQGPLVTYGQGPNNSVAGFNATETICANVREILARGYDYVVFTWTPNGVREEEALDKLRGAGVHVMAETVPDMFDPDHRYKQHWGVYRGMTSLLSAAEGVTHVLKIRTDMKFPIQFWNWVERVANENDDRLHVSELMERPFYMGDFVYLARKQVLSSFLEKVIESSDTIIHPCIALDMGIKYSISRRTCAAYRGSGSVKLRFLFDSVFATRRYAAEWNQNVSDAIGIMPKRVWQQIIWRDRRMGEFLDSDNFKFDREPLVSTTSFRENWSLLVKDFCAYWTKARKHSVLRSLIFGAFKGLDFVKRLRRKALLYGEYLTNKNKGVVLGRVACLGKEIFQMHPYGEQKNVLVNQQKMRVDLFVDLVLGGVRCRPELVRMHLARSDIYPFLEEQARIPWLDQNSVEYMLMDSFAELTDQLFVHRKEGWAFCCHYSDIEHSPEFDAEFECRGLLEIERLERSYRAFFEWLESTHPNTQVIFLHFPTALDPREIFKERAREIARVIEQIAKEKTYIHTLSVEESEVTSAAGDTFPYHFGRETNMAFLRKWNLQDEYSNT